MIEYPKMLYKSESESIVVDGEIDEQSARKSGFMDFADLNKPKKTAPKPKTVASSDNKLPDTSNSDSDVAAP